MPACHNLHFSNDPSWHHISLVAVPDANLSARFILMFPAPTLHSMTPVMFPSSPTDPDTTKFLIEILGASHSLPIGTHFPAEASYTLTFRWYSPLFQPDVLRLISAIPFEPVVAFAPVMVMLLSWALKPSSSIIGPNFIWPTTTAFVMLTTKPDR